MQLQVMIEPHNGASYDDQLTLARHVQSLELDGLFRADHYYSVASPRRSEWLTDTWTTLAGLARETSGITLGSLVSAATFRLPSALAVVAAQVDAMSGGRVELGIGAGWWRAEHEAFGIPFATTRDRFERLAEQLSILTGLWSTPAGTGYSHHGTHYTLDGAPGIACLRPGGPPIIVGGSGPVRTPELAARFADEFNSGWLAPDATAVEFTRVDRACERIGRDPLTIRHSTVQTLCIGDSPADLDRRAADFDSDATQLAADPAGITGTPVEAAGRVAAYAAAGAERLYLELLDLTDLDQLSLFAAAVRPLLR